MKTFFYTILILLSVCPGLQANKTPLIYKIDLKKEIGSTTWIYMQNGLQMADSLHADCILLHMNTYGGTVIHADSIRTAILNSPIPVYAFIDNNAASAGALIAIACDSIYMRKGASMGAATVVDQTGAAMPDKYQSYMRATIRSTAEAHGADTLYRENDTIIKWRRDPLIAEAMVDQRIVVPGLCDSTRVLTFTALEAIKHGYCEGIAETPQEVIEKHLGYKEYRLETYKPTFYDEIKGFLVNPALQALLIMFIIGGIYFELQTPGLGFPSVIALSAAVLYFAPLYIDGLAANWEIILFVLGVICVTLEIFVFPGFGISGILGGIFITTSLILAMVNNINFDFKEVNRPDITRSVFTVISGIALAFALMLYISHKIGQKGFLRRVALNTTQEIREGYIGVSPSLTDMVHKEGVASTPLMPSGKIEIDNDRYDAIALYGYIEKNERVKVIKFENNQLYVISITEK